VNPRDTEQWRTFARFYRGAWRPTAAWVCVGTLAVNGMILPLFRVRGVFVGEPMDWQGLAVFIAGLAAFAHYRSRDLQNQVTT